MTPYKNESFAAWFRRHKFRNFTADEFTSYFEVNRRGAQNMAPPREMWQNILPTLRLVDDLRDHFGRPCVLLSSYRGDEYNRRCGGVKYSQHRQFTALDIAVSGVSPKKVFNYLLARRKSGDFKGGLGLYPTFVHLDTRGNNATWGI